MEMASVSPSASPYAAPPSSAHGSPRTSVLPPPAASSSTNSSHPNSGLPGSPSPVSSPLPVPPSPSDPPTNGSSPLSPPAPPASPSAGPSSPPVPQLSPPSPPLLPPAPVASPSGRSSSPTPPPHQLVPPSPLSHHPPEVPPKPPPSLPTRPAKAPKSSSLPPPAAPSEPPQNSHLPTPSSQYQPVEAPPALPPSDTKTGLTPPWRQIPAPTHAPSTSHPVAPPPSSSKLAAPLSTSTVPQQSPIPSLLPNAISPTLVPTSSEMDPAIEKSSSIDTGGTVGIGIGIGIVILCLVGFVIWNMHGRRRQSKRFSGGHIILTSVSTSTAPDSSVMKIASSAPLIGSSSRSEFLCSPDKSPSGSGNSGLWFTYDDLAKATHGFSAENFLGEGGFGSVHKGRLDDGQEVAVKQLKVGAKQGERQFSAEVDIISRVHHRHLVSLVGYCIAENHKLLVYEYVPNNTLYFHLHGEKGALLDWATRVKITIGAARGLAYLHEDCHPRIIHRDIKSANILLDNNFEARLSDFGLAKLALDARTHITTRVMGTFGYMAPEYAISGKLTEKSDVYSFGVVLLELITGRKPVDMSQSLGVEGLVEWARPLMSHALEHEEFEGLADPRLEGNYVESEMFGMIEAAAACVRNSAAKRPRMGQIVRAFGSFSDSDLTNGMSLGKSTAFDSAQQSLEIRALRRMQFVSR